MAGRKLALSALILAVFPAVAQAADPALADLSLEELAEITITSVSRRPEKLSDAAASVFVITGDDIRRSGATSLPEALRLAPNLQVARISATQYAISARGFNNLVSNKLLVLIDGRTVYTPLFSGVFWDQQDVLLEDVERIEVISGPGATLWGANAVNGVINVITKSAASTQGDYASLGAGNLEHGAAARHGIKLGESGSIRFYAKSDSIQNTKLDNGSSALDGWERTQAGFRSDWGGGRDRFTLQGDTYKAHSDDRGSVTAFPFGTIAFGRIEVAGSNVLGRWTRQLDDGAEFKLQAYYDYTDRSDRFLFSPTANIFDLEFQHSLPVAAHRLLWGGGYRYATDQVAPGFGDTFIPDSKKLHWSNVFVQDQFPIARSVEATLGVKFERNDYTGLETLPNARLAWKPSEQSLVWTSLSRAVRAPSRFDREVYLPNPFFGLVPGQPQYLVQGGPNFVSEVANVFELGYRAQASQRLSFSITAFYNEWDKLRSGTSVPVQLENKISGHVYGLETWGTVQAASNWRLSAGLTTLHENLHLEPGSTDPVGVNNDTLRNDPDYFWQLRSSVDLPGKMEFDLGVRNMAKLDFPAVPSYTAVDMRLGWRPAKNVEFSLTLTNAFDPGHPEFGAAGTRSEIARGIFGKVALRI